MKIIGKIIVSLLLTSIFMLTFAGCTAKKEPVSRIGFYFDTVITIKIYDASSPLVIDECFALAARYEKLFSRTKEGSDIWNINHAGGLSVQVDAETAALISTALAFSELTEGAVDPSIGAVSALWDFGADSANKVPAPEQIKNALSHVDWQKVSVQGNTVTLSDPDMMLDLGFIAKGYIADKMKEALLTEGVSSALINLGGNVLAIGSRPDKEPFLVGIQKPFSPTGTSVTSIPVTDLTVVTSGIYERYFEYESQIYHHILDTKTGYPAKNNLSEVTIAAASSTDADALSTACFVLGLEKGMALIESLEDTEALFVTGDGALHPTSGLKLAP